MNRIFKKLLVIGVLLHGVLGLAHEYPSEQQISDFIIMMMRHKQLMQVNTANRRSPAKLFGEVGPVLDTLGELAAELEMKSKISVLTTGYVPGTSIQYDLSNIKQQLLDAYRDAGETSGFRQTIQETLEVYTQPLDRDQSVLKLLPFFFNDQGQLMIEGQQDRHAYFEEQLNALTMADLVNKYQDFYPYHLRSYVTAFEDKSKRWQKSDRIFTEKFIEKEISNIPEIKTVIENKEQRFITSEEVSSPVFAIMRGNFAEECATASVPYFSLHAKTKTYWIHLSDDLKDHPDGYIFIVEVTVQDRILPYIINLSGRDLTKEDIHQVITQVAVASNTRTVIIPDLSLNGYLSNYLATSNAYKEYESTSVSVILPEKWQYIPTKTITGIVYYKKENLEKARMISISPHVFEAAKRQNPMRIIHTPYDSNVIDSIHEKPLIERAMIAANLSLEDDKLDVYGLSKTLQLTSEQIDLSKKMLELDTYSAITYDIYLGIQEAFKTESGPPPSLKEMLSFVPPEKSISSFNGIRLHKEGQKLLTNQKWKRMGQTLYANIKEKSEVSNADKLSLYDLVSKKDKANLIPLVAKVIEGNGVSDISHVASKMVSDLEKNLQVKFDPKNTNQAEQLKLYSKLYATYKSINVAPKYKLLRLGLNFENDSVQRIHRMRNIYEKHREQHLNPNAWQKLVHHLYHNLNYTDKTLFLREEKIPYEDKVKIVDSGFLSDAVFLHALLPGEIQKSILTHACQGSQYDELKKYLLALHASNQPVLKAMDYRSDFKKSIIKISQNNQIDLVASLYQKYPDHFNDDYWKLLANHVYQNLKKSPEDFNVQGWNTELVRQSALLGQFLPVRPKTRLIQKLRTEEIVPENRALYIQKVHQYDPMFVVSLSYKKLERKMIEELHPVQAGVLLAYLNISHGGNYLSSHWDALMVESHHDVNLSKIKRHVEIYEQAWADTETQKYFWKLFYQVIQHHSKMNLLYKKTLFQKMLRFGALEDSGQYMRSLETHDSEFLKTQADSIFYLIKTYHRFRSPKSIPLMKVALFVAPHVSDSLKENAKQELYLKLQSKIFSNYDHLEKFDDIRDKHETYFSETEWNVIQGTLENRAMDTISGYSHWNEKQIVQAVYFSQYVSDENKAIVFDRVLASDSISHIRNFKDQKFLKEKSSVYISESLKQFKEHKPDKSLLGCLHVYPYASASVQSELSSWIIDVVDKANVRPEIYELVKIRLIMSKLNYNYSLSRQEYSEAHFPEKLAQVMMSHLPTYLNRTDIDQGVEIYAAAIKAKGSYSDSDWQSFPNLIRQLYKTIHGESSISGMRTLANEALGVVLNGIVNVEVWPESFQRNLPYEILTYKFPDNFYCGKKLSDRLLSGDYWVTNFEKISQISPNTQSYTDERSELQKFYLAYYHAVLDKLLALDTWEEAHYEIMKYVMARHDGVQKDDGLYQKNAVLMTRLMESQPHHAAFLELVNLQLSGDLPAYYYKHHPGHGDVALALFTHLSKLDEAWPAHHWLGFSKLLVTVDVPVRRVGLEILLKQPNLPKLHISNVMSALVTLYINPHNFDRYNSWSRSYSAEIIQTDKDMILKVVKATQKHPNHRVRHVLRWELLKKRLSKYKNKIESLQDRLSRWVRDCMN